MRERQLPTTVRLSEKDARDVLLAELLETPTEAAPGEKPVWTSVDAAAATRDARHLAGERRTPGLFLPLRARLVLARLKERRVKTTLERTGIARELGANLVPDMEFAVARCRVVLEELDRKEAAKRGE